LKASRLKPLLPTDAALPENDIEQALRPDEAAGFITGVPDR